MRSNGPTRPVGWPAPLHTKMTDVRDLTVKLKANEGGNAEIIDEVELYSKSYALVVGIDDYANGWPRLGQAVKDAHRVSDALKARGFGVTLKTNLKSGELRRAFEDFLLEKGGVPDERGEGYLIPADGVLERDRVKFCRPLFPCAGSGNLYDWSVTRRRLKLPTSQPARSNNFSHRATLDRQFRMTALLQICSFRQSAASGVRTSTMTAF